MIWTKSLMILRERPMWLPSFDRGFGQCSASLGPTSISLNTVPLVNSVPSLSILSRISSVIFLAYEVGVLAWRKKSQLFILHRNKENTLEITSASQVDTHCVRSGWKDRGESTKAVIFFCNNIFVHYKQTHFASLRLIPRPTAHIHVNLINHGLSECAQFEIKNKSDP